MTPQHNQILNILSDHQWHCTVEFDEIPMRDHRKRVSELQKLGYLMETEKCRGRCGRPHSSNVTWRRLLKSPVASDFDRSEVLPELPASGACCPSWAIFQTHARSCPSLQKQPVNTLF